jgi:hypothetical protein
VSPQRKDGEGAISVVVELPGNLLLRVRSLHGPSRNTCEGDSYPRVSLTELSELLNLEIRICETNTRQV